ncbi:MAG: hypothetical protein QW445_07575 [Candidatus Bathyarchaeia archaeon]
MRCWLRLVVHVLGAACLGGAVLLQALVFFTIAVEGRFVGCEVNSAVLAAEVALSLYALVYYVYFYRKLLEFARQQESSLTSKNC